MLAGHLLKTILPLVLATGFGAVAGWERAAHGRSAGMRTYALVCLGAALTSLISLYIIQNLGLNSDAARIPAQIISGIGFLGAGMIVLRKNNTVSGLTTAAGIWTTSIIGIALGYGFYIAALSGMVLYLVAVVLLSKFEVTRKSVCVLYLEIDDLTAVNAVVEQLDQCISGSYHRVLTSPKSEKAGNLGMELVLLRHKMPERADILKIDHVLMAVEVSQS